MLRILDTGVSQKGTSKKKDVQKRMALPFIKINLILEITYYFRNH